MRFGYRRLTAMLARTGTPANHKRVYRLYCEEGLTMRIRQRRRIRWTGAASRPAASRPNERWSIDFVSDCVRNGRVIRMLTMVDDYTRECPAVEVDTSLGGLRVRRYWIESRGREVCRKRSFWITGRSSAVVLWLPGAQSVGCDWSSFSQVSRCRMPTWKASTGGCATNA